MRAKNVQVQTPGAAPTAEPELSAPSEATQGTELPPDLQALVDAQIAKGVAAGLAKVAPAPKAKPAPAKLPSYDEVVASKPTSSVLTDQGWLVVAPKPTAAELRV